MKTFKYFCKIVLLFSLTMFLSISCQEKELNNEVGVGNGISNEIIGKLKGLGFDVSQGFSKYRNGYLVEYDIFLTKEAIDVLYENRIKDKGAKVDHYRTSNLVTGVPRPIQVYMDPAFGTFMQNAFDNALSRYNNLNLGLNFQRSTNSAVYDIRVIAFNENSNVLGHSAGFPTNGRPANTIELNTFFYNDNSQRGDAISVITHEIGHAIGFRHTDYMDRRFSCGDDPNPDEGDNGVGAVHIPNTPTNPSANSWMLACSNGFDRPFTSEDQTALNALYGCGLYFPQIASSTMDNVSFSYGISISSGSHQLRIQPSANCIITYSVLYGNATITDQNSGSGSYCNFTYGGGGAVIRVNLSNGCYNRNEQININ